MADSQIRITADVLQAQAALRNLANSLDALKSVSDQADRSMQSLKKTTDMSTVAFRALTGAVSVAAIVNMADAATNVNNKLRSVTTSTEEAATAFQTIGRIATTSGQNFEAVADLYQKVGLQSRELGLTQQEVGRITQNFSKALAVSGTTGAAAASAIYQFGQALGRTKVAYEDIRQLQESSSNTLRLISQQFGMSSAEFIAAVQAGKVSSEQLALAVNSLGGELDKVKLDRTIGQSIENIRTNFILLINNFEKSTGVFAGIANVLDLLAKNIDTVVVAGSVFFTIFAAKKIYDIATAFKDLNSVMGKNPVLKLALLAAGAAAAIYEMVGANKAVADAQEEVLQKEEKIKGVTDARKISGDALLKQQSIELEGYFRKLDAETRMIGLSGIELATKKNLVAAAEQLKTTEDQLHPAIVARITARTREIETAKMQIPISMELIKAHMETNRLSIDNLDTREEQAAVDAAILKYGKDFNDTMEQTIRLTVQQMQLNRERAAQQRQDALLAGTATAQTRAQQIDTATSTIARLDPRLALENQYQTQKAALEETAFKNEIQRQQALYRLEEEYNNRKNQLIIQRADTERRMREESIIAEQLQQGKRIEQARAYAAFEMKTNAEKTQFALQAGAEMFSALGAQNKKAFEAAKAFNIANAIMNTYLAVTKAMATYPWPFSLIAAGAALASGMAQVAQIRSQTYSGRQLGGPVMGNTPYLVGEAGPELFVPNTNGSIVRNQDIGGGGPVNVNFTINAVDTAGFDELLTERRGVIQSIIRDAMLEKGQRF